MHLSRLKKLVLHDIRFLETVRWSDNTSFPSVDYLSVDFTGDDWEFELIARCPNLTTLVLGSASPGDLLKRSIPACRQLCVLVAFLSVEEMAEIIEALPPMKCLQVMRYSIPSELLYLSFLQRHYATLEHVHLPRYKNINTAQVLLILSSCPNLRSFAANEISGSDIAKGQPWVCLGLEIFSAWIKFDELDVNQGTFLESRHAVYTQLSRLSRLRVLDLRRHGRWWIGTDLTLRLDEGLKTLRSLKMLECLKVPRCVAKRLRKRDIEWMVKMWPSLRTIWSLGDRKTQNFEDICKWYGLSQNLADSKGDNCCFRPEDATNGALRQPFTPGAFSLDFFKH